MTGSFVKIYGTILDSSLWSEAPHVRLLFIAMLAMADYEGTVQASVPGLARRANLSIPDTLDALEVLGQPDAFDRSGVDEGRRVREVAGGWRLVNYGRYRDMRTESQALKAQRQKRWRDKQASPASQASRVDDVDGRETEVSVSPSASLSAFDSQELEQQQKPVWRETADEVVAFAEKFGAYANDVEGLIRSARYGPAIVAILRDRLDNQKIDPAVLGEAVREYLAKEGGNGAFDARFFDGFVRRIKGRRAQDREAQEIKQHEVRRIGEEEAADREAAARRRAVAEFQEKHPARYAELVGEAEALVDPKYQRGRGILVKAELVKLIERELAKGNTGGGNAST